MGEVEAGGLETSQQPWKDNGSLWARPSGLLDSLHWIFRVLTFLFPLLFVILNEAPKRLNRSRNNLLVDDFKL